jgi:hypothetical protein
MKPEYEAFGMLKETTMTAVMRTWAVGGAATVGVLVSGGDGFAAEKFQKLGGSQIRAKFIGMEMTDNGH